MEGKGTVGGRKQRSRLNGKRRVGGGRGYKVEQKGGLC